MIVGEVNLLKCPNGHRITENITISAACDICDKRKTTLWLCITCQYGICQKCKDWFETSQGINAPGMKCIRRHNLRLTENPQQFYKRKGKYLCDGCLLLKVETSAHCRNCKLDYCLECLKKIERLIESSAKLLCKCNRQIVWRYDEICKKCKKCSRKYEKSGSFICLDCGFKYCISCSYSTLTKS